MAKDPWSVTTGGILRFPGSQQSSDTDNLVAEGWVRGAYTFHSSDTGQFSVFLRAKAVADTARYSYNNTSSFGVGLAYRFKPGKRSRLTFSLRHDWSENRITGISQSGPRILVDYFLFDYRRADPDAHMLGLPQKSRITSLFANLTYPDTLVPGDDNAVVNAGFEMSAVLPIPDSSWDMAPFVSVHGAWDSDGNSYNNKIQPGVGLKLRHRIPGGTVQIGLRYRADYRWVSDTFRSGPSLFVSWFAAF